MTLRFTAVASIALVAAVLVYVLAERPERPLPEVAHRDQAQQGAAPVELLPPEMPPDAHHIVDDQDLEARVAQDEKETWLREYADHSAAELAAEHLAVKERYHELVDGRFREAFERFSAGKEHPGATVEAMPAGEVHPIVVGEPCSFIGTTEASYKVTLNDPEAARLLRKSSWLGMRMRGDPRAW